MTRDMDTVKMSYEEMIDTLKGLVFGTFDRTTAKEREALDMVIKHCEQSHHVIPIPKGATNGDMIKAMFPTDYTHIYDRSVSSWWNAPYKGQKNESSKIRRLYKRN